MPSENSDPPSLIRVFVVRSIGSWGQYFFKWTAKTLIRLGGCADWSVSSLGAMAILLVLSCGGSCIPCSWVPSIERESDCGSRSRRFDSGPATYRLLKLIMRIFSLIEKGSCQMFNLSAQEQFGYRRIMTEIYCCYGQKPQNRPIANLSLLIK